MSTIQSGDAGGDDPLDPELLRRVPLFARCTGEQLEGIAAVARRRTVEPGTRLLDEGSPAHQLVVVLEGVAEVHRDGAPIDTVGAGDFVGELAVLRGYRHTASVIATTAMVVLVFPSDATAELLHHRGVAARLLERVVSWLPERAPDEDGTGPAGPPRVRRRTSDASAGWDSITVAEQRVVDLVADGRSNPEVAAALNISRHTVESHLKSVYAKLGIGSRTELAVEALRRRS